VIIQIYKFLLQVNGNPKYIF